MMPSLSSTSSSFLLRFSLLRFRYYSKTLMVYQHNQQHAASFSSISTLVSNKPNLVMGYGRRDTTKCIGRKHTIFPPVEKRSVVSDLVVVLDMDECLIHSKFLSDPKESSRYAHQTTSANEQHVDNTNIVDSFEIVLPHTGDVVQVYQRPHLHEFLQYVSDRFETHIFTAAMEVYAKPVLDVLDPMSTRFTQRWYRDSCVPTKHGAFVKNLSVLQKNEARMVLVDNNPLSFLANPSNGILVKSFYNDASDKTLLAVMQLLEELDEHIDVRPHLDERFGLKNAFDEWDKDAIM